MFFSQVPLTPEGWECSKSRCRLGSSKGVSSYVGQQVSTGFPDRGVGRRLRAPGLGRPRLRLTDRLERRRHDIEHLGVPDMTRPLRGSLGCPQIGTWREKRGRDCPQLRDFLGSNWAPHVPNLSVFSATSSQKQTFQSLSVMGTLSYTGILPRVPPPRQVPSPGAGTSSSFPGA